MALTAKERSVLPTSALPEPARRHFPRPTEVQARRANVRTAHRVSKCHRHRHDQGTESNLNVGWQNIRVRARLGSALVGQFIQRRWGHARLEGLLQVAEDLGGAHQPFQRRNGRTQE
jgi:hypothetical protein